MTVRPQVFLLVLAACSGSHAGNPPTGGRRDAGLSSQPVDAAIDAIGDARPDALADAAIEAPAIDAPATDAPIDAPVDAPPLGAGWTFLGDPIFDHATPGFRFDHAMVLDSTHGQLVVFGGDHAPPLLDDTWVSTDGVTWALQTPPTSPPARAQAAMAFDSGRGRVVLFGGRTRDGALADTWEWDGTTWLERHPATSPPELFQAMMAYDPIAARTILFGGVGPLNLLNETWAWDGTTWTKLAPATSPAARSGATTVYDSARHRIVLFGGDSQVDNNGDGVTDLLGDTWEWDGTTWLQRTPATAPSPRVLYAMAYDPERARTVLFGGLTSGLPETNLNDTWEWDGAAWARQVTTRQPSLRRDSAMAYLPARHAVLLYAGADRTGFFGDLWAFIGL